MIKVRFHKADGTLDREVEARPGQRLLDVAWASAQPLEGACEGVMACSTCHVIVEKADFERLPPASDEEEDLLDLAAHATRTSRLACQIILREDLKSLDVRIPPSAKNWLYGCGGSRNDPRRYRCGCFLPDLTRLATTSSARLPPRIWVKTSGRASSPP